MSGGAFMFDCAVAAFAAGDLRWDGDDIRVALVTDGYEPDQRSHTSRSDFARFEVEPSGSYELGGAKLPARSVVRGELGADVLLRAGGVRWDDVTAAFRYSVIYRSSGGSRDDDRLVAYADMGRQMVTSAEVRVDYGERGVAGFMVQSADGV